MWQTYYSVTSVEEALKILGEYHERARIVAGATDLILEIERGVRKGIDALVDITRLPGLDRIVMDEDEVIHLGPLVTHTHCAASKLIVERAFPLAQAAWAVGAPQIRNRGTVAGNLITASPANDTISPLMALGAQVKLASLRGERIVPLAEFYSGVRRTLMQPDEMLVDIVFPALQPNQRGVFMKLGLRRAQAISVVNAAILLTFDERNLFSPGNGEALPKRKLKQAAITLGAVAPTIIHARNAEVYLMGRELSDATIAHTAELAQQAARPIDDVRGSAAYRSEMIRVCVSRGLQEIWQDQERVGFPAFRNSQSPIRNSKFPDSPATCFRQGVPIVTRINGKETVFPSGVQKSLLRLLREDAGLTGTKEGCAEGECGACTIFLDGVAVMACLVPAARAHGAEIVTIEGLSQDGQLHPVQQAFIVEGAVQCGYCTPGLVMSAVKLLEERPHPSREEIRQAITGNLCRCTGYYKIVQAIERASQEVIHG
jgi:carbon-monoxide dehydrogenase medium subunit